MTYSRNDKDVIISKTCSINTVLTKQTQNFCSVLKVRIIQTLVLNSSGYPEGEKPSGCVSLGPSQKDRGKGSQLALLRETEKG